MTEKILVKKLKVFLALVTIIFAVLISRIAYVQLVQTERFTTLSEQNRIRPVTIPAKRGEVFDSTGKVILAKDRPVYSVSVSWLGIQDQDLDKVAATLASILAIDENEIKEKIKDPGIRKFEPIRIAKDVPLEVVTKIEENRADLPGVEIAVEPMREYVYQDFMPHILGYVREITEKQLERHKDDGYSMGDRYGQAGLENMYEEFLRGQDGNLLVEVDKSQHPVRELAKEQPIPGNNLVLNIDYRLQKTAEESMDRTMASLQQNGYPDARAGAVVMVDVNSGKVLAMASKPGFDPNLFNGKITPEQSEALFGGKETNPFPAFNNRAMMGYPPGSTFKMITAAAVLESGKATIHDTYFDPGSVRLFGRSYGCWKPSGHGTVNLVKAIQTSCNVYFYQMGLRAGVENLTKYVREFGLGQKTGIDLPNEASGLIPSKEWKRELNEPSLQKKYEEMYQEIEDKYAEKIGNAKSESEKKRLLRQKENELKWKKKEYDNEAHWSVEWREYETIIMSIGQGYNLYTPLQLANYVAAIANGGIRYQPYLVDSVVDYKGDIVKKYDKKEVGKVDVSPETLAAIRRGMRAVAEPGGTAYGIFREFPVEVAGKTGSAQTGKDKNGKDKPTHGLFVAYAPYDKPEVAVAGIIEYAGHGGSSAGLVVRDLLAEYFKIDRNQIPQGGVSEE
ncbi:penicillin-binding protein 2 [Phosphitispora fastidiosa]|uniref:penicillin-binding protein 2 n=1 Tax=Phosphitispora fastidiosa TaxID=2837202 RepID=UPI001E623208|nr:penicillin-binding protein 2 [Phosphitispora fastidiosa]MBU7008742.1 penicillin-binding protein 2 [Phosphitispora fastidiosa]